MVGSSFLPGRNGNHADTRTPHALAERLGVADRVELLDGAWGKEKIELFRRAAILFFPSHFENFPLVALEAAAAAMPILSTPVGALPEFFTEGRSALFVPVGAIDSMANAIDRLIRRSESAGTARHRGEGQCFNEKLSRSRIMASLDSVYQDVLHNRI